MLFTKSSWALEKNHDRKTQEVKMSFSQEVQGTLVSSARARQSRMKAIFS
ncbi:hypothetical protein [Neglectibacter timonensis]|jgi:hypothetical protein